MFRWLPDAPPTTPEIYTDMNGMYPTKDGGYATIPVISTTTGLFSDQAVNTTTPKGGFVRYVDGTAAFIYNASATGNKVYEGTTDVTGTAAALTSLAMYGNVCIIAQGRSANVKAKTGTGGAFADLAGTPPKADYVVSTNLAVMLLSYNDGTDTPDGWWASDIGDHTTWTPASSNQAANGRLLEAPGPIRGAIAFKDMILAFKDSAVFVGRYVGRPTIWQWKLLRGDIGCSRQEAILTDGEYVYFMGAAGVWKTDGYSFQRIDEGVWSGTADTGVTTGIGKEYQVAANGGAYPFGLYDELTRCCVWWINRTLDNNGYAFNTVTGAWGDIGPYNGLAQNSTNWVVSCAYPYSRAMQIQTSGGGVGNYSDPAWLVVANGKWSSMNNTNANAATTKISAYVTTGRYGDYKSMTQVTRIIPLLVPNYADANGVNAGASATFTMTPYTADSVVEDLTAGTDVSSSTDLKRFDYNKVARFHAVKIANATHGWKIMGVDAETQKRGLN